MRDVDIGAGNGWPIIEAVHGSVHSGALVTGHGRTEESAAAPTGLPTPAVIGRAVAHEPIPAATLMAVLVSIRDPIMAVIVGAAAFAMIRLHQLARGTRFGFADGFIGFRSETGWPRGVQEDDDFRWTWTGEARGASGSPQSPTR